MSKINWKLYGGTNNPRSMRSFEDFWNLLESENYQLISPYKGATTKLTLKCPHNHEFNIVPYSFKNIGTRCPICQGLSKEHAKEQFEKLVQKEGYTLLSPYKGVMKKVKLRCPRNHEFNVTPNHFKNHGTRCPICSGNSKEHSKQEFENLVQNEGYELLDKYKNAKTKVKMRCPQGHTFEMTPNNFKNVGQRCPICQGSFGERITYEYLTNLGLDFEIQKTFEGLIGVKNGGLLKFDFYISSLNLLLEINGEQHYKPFDHWGGEEQLLIQMENDNRKKAFARAMGINLVEIKCNGEHDGERLREELQNAIDEALFRFFGKAS